MGLAQAAGKGSRRLPRASKQCCGDRLQVQSWSDHFDCSASLLCDVPQLVLLRVRMTAMQPQCLSSRPIFYTLYRQSVDWAEPSNVLALRLHLFAVL